MSKYVLELRPNCKMVQQICEADGKVYVCSAGVRYFEELNSDYINDHYRDLQDDAYERGHGIGYQKGFEDGKAVNDKGCEGCQYEGKVVTGPPCISCCNSYRNQWTAKSDKIEVGDELIAYGGLKCIATVADYEKDTFYVMFTDGSCGKKDGAILKKTGRHFDITSILEEMKE